jgi:hypothetical protein
MSDQPLWSPSPERVRATRVMAFVGEANRRHQLSLATYRDLHAWTVKHPGLFWDLLWDFGGVIGDKGARLATDLDAMTSLLSISLRCSLLHSRNTSARSAGKINLFLHSGCPL